jgi:hypothetical protein
MEQWKEWKLLLNLNKYFMNSLPSLSSTYHSSSLFFGEGSGMDVSGFSFNYLYLNTTAAF